MRMDALLKFLWFTPGAKGWGIPAAFEGEGGVGKTDTIERTAERCGLKCVAPPITQMQPPDFLGIQVPMEKEIRGVRRLVTRYTIPEWVQEIFEEGRGVIFLDEGVDVDRSMQTAIQRAIHARKIGEVVLPRPIRMTMTHNPVASSTNGTELSATIANRMAHYAWNMGTVSDWRTYMLSEIDADTTSSRLVDDPEAEEARVEKLWPEAWADAKGMVAAFMDSSAGGEKMLHEQPALGDPASSKAWRSRRSWENAVRALAGARIHGLSDAESDLVLRGIVGPGAVVKLAEYRLKADMPRAADVLDGVVPFEHDRRRLDRTHAIMAACGALVVDPRCEKRQVRIDKLWGIIDALLDPAADLALPTAILLTGKDLNNTPAADKPIFRMGTALRAMGLRV